MIKITAICHSRKKFYHGKDIHWYEFKLDDDQNIMTDAFWAGNGRFVRVPETKYFEYGGSHDDALKDLTSTKVIDIIEGVEI